MIASPITLTKVTFITSRPDSNHKNVSIELNPHPSETWHSDDHSYTSYSESATTLEPSLGVLIFAKICAEAFNDSVVSRASYTVWAIKYN